MGHGDTDDLSALITDRHWRYVGSGHTPGAALIAAGIADDLAQNRAAAREALLSGGGAD
ncbi:hypothetical protein ACIHFC_22170 [Streptomyces sp. NPDC052013]|uniref:hypothetical protein n=1 Tax=Streptomyces sp. NPDC052013 TaxID=3365679 RepID=UPI0037D45337